MQIALGKEIFNNNYYRCLPLRDRHQTNGIKDPMSLRNKIESELRDACTSRNATVPEILTDDTVLLESGLDSLGFAVLVTNLEMTLGYDPFTLMENPIYPQTFGEFVAIYDRFKDHSVS